MDELEKNRVIERYNRRIDEFGQGINALASGNVARRNQRFQVLLESGIQEGDSVLDVGCGYADLSGYLENKLGQIRYSGIDINPRIVAHAKSLHPTLDLHVAAIDSTDLEPVDWVVSSSTFNLKLLAGDNYVQVGRTLASAYALAQKGVAFDFLTSYVDFRGNPEEAFYYEPERIFSIAKGITKRVSLRHDYPLFEFAVYLYPDFDGWKSLG